ncbi:MAG: hypothetical protein AAFU85_24125 [Planctomycetota bacterium]
MTLREEVLDASLASRLLTEHGKCEGQDQSAWSGDFPLPEPLVAFYRDVGPNDITIGGYGNPTFMPSLARLWEHQRGYRFHPTTSKRFPDWNADWIVVADMGADPYIYYEGRVLHAMHGKEKWTPESLFPDLNTMCAAFAVIGSVVKGAGLELADDDGYIRPQYYERARDSLASILGDDFLGLRVLETAGWH